MPYAEGVYEIHWQLREYNRHTAQLYDRLDNGQLRMVASWEQAPFETLPDFCKRWLRQVALDMPPAPAYKST